MADDKIAGILTKIFHDVFDSDDIVLRDDMTAADIDGWDSTKQVEIILAVEKRFGITFATQELDGLDSVGVLIAAIAQKFAA